MIHRTLASGGLGDPIRVAFVAPTLHLGGAERQMLMITRALHGADFQFRFVLLAERGPLADEAEALGVGVDVLSIRSQGGTRGLLQSAPQLVRAVNAYRHLVRDVDVVDAWLPPAYTFAGLARPLAPVPVLIAGRRSILGVHQNRTRIRRWAAAASMRYIDGVVANSRLAAAQAVTIEGVPSDQVHTVHNAVVPIVTTDADRREHRSRWGAKDADLVVGCVGNFLPGKGQFLLLDAATSIARLGDGRLRFVFVGRGPLRSTFEEAISARGMRDSVVLDETDLDARHLYCGFDLYVQASESEGLPNAVLEAAAAGLPIVATDVGGTGEVIRDGVDGILTPKGDAAAIADAIQLLAGDAGQRSVLAEKARRRADDFSISRLGDETAAIYRRYVQAARTGDEGRRSRRRLAPGLRHSASHAVSTSTANLQPPVEGTNRRGGQ